MYKLLKMCTVWSDLTVYASMELNVFFQVKIGLEM